MSGGLDPREMSEAERLAEIGRILATGFLRLAKKRCADDDRSHAKCAETTSVRLDISPGQSGRRNRRSPETSA